MHEYHDRLLGYDKRQIWHDGCPECEARGEDPANNLGTLDRARFAYAWQRAYAWNADPCPDVGLGPISHAERDLLTLLWRFQVALERNCDIPIGQLPARLPHWEVD
jgi:hypothetical protein